MEQTNSSRKKEFSRIEHERGEGRQWNDWTAKNVLCRAIYGKASAAPQRKTSQQHTQHPSSLCRQRPQFNSFSLLYGITPCYLSLHRYAVIAMNKSFIRKTNLCWGIPTDLVLMTCLWQNYHRSDLREHTCPKRVLCWIFLVLGPPCTFEFHRNTNTVPRNYPHLTALREDCLRPDPGSENSEKRFGEMGNKTKQEKIKIRIQNLYSV